MIILKHVCDRCGKISEQSKQLVPPWFHVAARARNTDRGYVVGDPDPKLCTKDVCPDCLCAEVSAASEAILSKLGEDLAVDATIEIKRYGS